MKTKERLIDLSDIKEDDLDKTASFTELMSRSERKKRNEEKKIQQKNQDENFFENYSLENNELENVSNLESNEEYLNKNEQYVTLMNENGLNKIENEANNNLENDFIFEEKKKYGSGLIITMGLFFIMCIIIYIYNILYTSSLDKQRYLYINSLGLGLIGFLFGISIISGRKFSKFLSILNYLLSITYILFNILLLLKYIK